MSASTGSNPLTSHMSFQQKVEHYKQLHSGGWGKSSTSSKVAYDQNENISLRVFVIIV